MHQNLSFRQRKGYGKVTYPLIKQGEGCLVK